MFAARPDEPAELDSWSPEGPGGVAEIVPVGTDSCHTPRAGVASDRATGRNAEPPGRAVAQGAAAEDRLALGGPPVTRIFATGEAFHFSASDIHRVRHTGTAPAVTIHAYSPPLWRMGAYEVLPGGELRRHSLSYAEELRPLDHQSVSNSSS